MQKINECKGDWKGVRNAFRQIGNGSVPAVKQEMGTIKNLSFYGTEGTVR